ncbi:ABC transporter ATP-binding protein/permease [Amycolatopsis pigmentata]|uniref:ATP-binding cassette domain-containing protein n=1 Tax=Amycolatopsis pigmentata TaxID=450801 RepID=A0ABW5FMY8_9PSEU
MSGISLVCRPGELVTVIGPSGAGKTALLDLLAGLRPPSNGTVRHNGAAPGLVGYVPQDDIIHRDLPLARTLRYAARLRLPAGTSSTDLDAAVAEVLAVLGLTDRAGRRVGSLSGGERKRASIAVELLTRPPALFLDEPTSGLDPATALDLMALLRRIADGGSTVVFTTHNPADVAGCDTVAVLARGRLTFAGTPAAALAHFGANTVEGIYQFLKEPELPPWSPEVPGQFPAAPPPFEPPRLGAFGQWRLLTTRGLDLLLRNRLTLAILLGSPVMIIVMFLMLFRAGAFDFADPSPNTTVMILFWMAFGGFFFGLTYGLSQICDEYPILRRERFTGLRLGPYTLSKLAALLPLLLVVDAVLLVVLRLTDRLPALDFPGLATLFVTLALSSGCALTLGLLSSASVSKPSQATLMLPMLCFPQVLFVGAFLPVPVMAAAGRWVSYAMSNRWAFEALGHTAGLPGLWRSGGSPLGPPLLASYQDTFDHPVWVDWVILAGFLLLAAIATQVVLTVRTKGTRR